MADIYDGRVNGTVELTDMYVVIRRKGVLGFLTQGLKGDKRIPFTSITSVQFKEAGLANGYIQLGVLGGNENRGGILAATQDENTVMFRRSVREDFRRLRENIEARVASSRNSSGSNADKPSSFAELAQMATLLEKGLLTPEEFQEQKRRLLGT